MLGAFAEFERDRISERIKATKQRQKQSGEFSGGVAPFGPARPMAAEDLAAPPLGAVQESVAGSEMRLGTSVTGIGGETQLLVNLAAIVAVVLAIFAVAFLLEFWCGRTRRRR